MVYLDTLNLDHEFTQRRLRDGQSVLEREDALVRGFESRVQLAGCRQFIGDLDFGQPELDELTTPVWCHTFNRGRG